MPKNENSASTLSGTEHPFVRLDDPEQTSLGATLIEGTHTVRNVRRDFVEWHRGRTPYVLWAIDLDRPAICGRVDEAATHLEGLLLEGYARQPHVTLELCGFAADPPAQPDEFGKDWIAAQCAALQSAGLAPFEIEIGALSSFSSAPFLQLADAGGHIAAVRAALAIEGTHRLLGRYVPHVTVGLYRDAWPADAVRARLAGFSAGPALRCTVERISLMGYDPAEIGGSLRRLGEFDLSRQVMGWQT